MRARLLAAMTAAVLAVPFLPAAADAATAEHKCDQAAGAEHKCDSDHKCDEAVGGERKCDEDQG